MPELSIYTLVLFAHLMSAIVLMGSGLVAPLAHRFVREARTLADLRRWLDFGRRSSKWNPIAALVLLGSGIYLGSIGWWAQPWFYVAIGAWVLNAALAGGVVGRTASVLDQAAARAGDGPVPPSVDALRRSRGWEAAHGAMLGSDVAILYVMMAKPGLTGSVGLVIVAIALALGVSWLRGKKGTVTFSDRRVLDT